MQKIRLFVCLLGGFSILAHAELLQPSDSVELVWGEIYRTTTTAHNISVHAELCARATARDARGRDVIKCADLIKTGTVIVPAQREIQGSSMQSSLNKVTLTALQIDTAADALTKALGEPATLANSRLKLSLYEVNKDGTTTLVDENYTAFPEPSVRPKEAGKALETKVTLETKKHDLSCSLTINVLGR